MAKPLLPDDLWDIIEPLLPPERPKPIGRRPIQPNVRGSRDTSCRALGIGPVTTENGCSSSSSP
jgi:hypothetical protein